MSAYWLAYPFEQAGIAWFSVKTQIEAAVGFSHDALHVLLGVCLQLLFAALFRTTIKSIRPWLALLALALANELNDFRAEGWTFFDVQLEEAWRDLALTMVLPAILLVIARWKPGLFHAASAMQESTCTATTETAVDGADQPTA